MKKEKKNRLIKKEKQFLINSFLICGFVSVVFLIFARLIFINKSSQDIATSVSGIFGTALGFFGSILVYQAFREQVKANKLIQKQFRIQIFESRLYKMLDIYNVNVSDLKFFSRKTGKLFESKAAFYQMISNYNKLKKEILAFNKAKNYATDQIIELDYKNKLYNIKENINIEVLSILELSYVIFFYGVGVTGRKNIKSLFEKKYDKEYLNKLLNFLSNKPIEHNTSEEVKKNWKTIFVDFEDFDSPNNNSFDKYYNGHQSNLGHYYRHMYMIIKFIDEEPILTYLEKWEYSKLLRTQLSNHEQELFFLNSISILGRDWELNQNDLREVNENKKFITKYDLIKNVSKSVINKYNIKSFYPDVEFEYEEETHYRKELNENFYL